MGFWRSLMGGKRSKRVEARPIVGIDRAHPAPWGELKTDKQIDLLVIGLGDVSHRDEGVGINVIRHLKRRGIPKGVNCVDGGQGDRSLLDPMRVAKRIVIVDASASQREPGSIDVVQPHCPDEFPETLSSYHAGLRRLLEEFYAPGEYVDVTLYSVAIDPHQKPGMGLSRPVWECVPRIADLVLEELLRDDETAA